MPPVKDDSCLTQQLGPIIYRFRWVVIDACSLLLPLQARNRRQCHRSARPIMPGVEQAQERRGADVLHVLLIALQRVPAQPVQERPAGTAARSST